MKKLDFKFLLFALFILVVGSSCESELLDSDLQAETRKAEITNCWDPNGANCAKDFLNCHYVDIPHDRTYEREEGCEYFTVDLDVLVSTVICHNADFREATVALIDVAIQDFIHQGDRPCSSDEALIAPIYFDLVNTPTGGNLRMTYACCFSKLDSIVTN